MAGEVDRRAPELRRVDAEGIDSQYSPIQEHFGLNRFAGPVTFVVQGAVVDDPQAERIMGPLVDNLATIGVGATYRTVDDAAWTERVKQFDYDMIVGWWSNQYSALGWKWKSTMAKRWSSPKCSQFARRS